MIDRIIPQMKVEESSTQKARPWAQSNEYNTYSYIKT